MNHERRMRRVKNLMLFRELVYVCQKIRLGHRVKGKPRLIKQKDNSSLFDFALRIKLMLDAIKPNQKTKKPNEAPAALLERSANASMSAILDSKVKVWTSIKRDFVVGV